MNEFPALGGTDVFNSGIVQVNSVKFLFWLSIHDSIHVWCITEYRYSQVFLHMWLFLANILYQPVFTLCDAHFESYYYFWMIKQPKGSWVWKMSCIEYVYVSSNIVYELNTYEFTLYLQTRFNSWFFQGLEHIKLLERLNLYPFITALGQVLHQFHYF